MVQNFVEKKGGPDTLQSNPRIVLLIDARENKSSDTEDSVVVTAIGEAGP
jgi:hypothetical protein